MLSPEEKMLCWQSADPEMEVKAYELSVFDAERRLSQWEMAEGAIEMAIRDGQEQLKKDRKTLKEVRKEIEECKATILKYSNR